MKCITEKYRGFWACSYDSDTRIYCIHRRFLKKDDEMYHDNLMQYTFEGVKRVKGKLCNVFFDRSKLSGYFIEQENDEREGKSWII